MSITGLYLEHVFEDYTRIYYGLYLDNNKCTKQGLYFDILRIILAYLHKMISFVHNDYYRVIP